MKKTIIAASIAAVVAAPAAFADVSISGQFNQEFYQTDGDATTADRNTDVVISASEDLGNGMKASVKMVMTGDNGSTHSGLTSGSTSVVGLSGDFGSVTFGKSEMFIESHVNALAGGNGTDTLTNEVVDTVGEKAEGTIQYTSPAMNGVKVVLGARSGTSSDVTSIGVEYSNGPLLVRAATADQGGTTSDAIAVQYKMDGLTLKVVNSEVEGSNDQTWYGASYTMGANTISANSNDERDINIYTLRHNLSKNVGVYVGMEDGATSATDKTLVGMQVKF